LNVATPLTAFTVNVPLTPAGVELIVTWAEDPATGFPFASWTCNTTGLGGIPTVPLTGGAVVNSSLNAGPAATEIEPLVTPANPGEAAESVKLPVAVNTRLLKVATPPAAFAINVPPTPVGVELIVTWEVVTFLFSYKNQ
jgi:hypothetical protein